MLNIAIGAYEAVYRKLCAKAAFDGRFLPRSRFLQWRARKDSNFQPPDS